MAHSRLYILSFLILISPTTAQEIIAQVPSEYYSEIKAITLAPNETLSLEIALQQVGLVLTQPNNNLHHSQYTLVICEEQHPVQIPLNLQNTCTHLTSYNCATFPIFSDFYAKAALAFFQINCNAYQEEQAAPLQEQLNPSASSSSKNQNSETQDKQTKNSSNEENETNEEEEPEQSTLQQCYNALEERASSYNGTPSLVISMNTTYGASERGPFSEDLHSATNFKGYNLPECLNGAAIPYYQYFKGPYKVRNLYQKTYLKEKSIYLGIINLYQNETSFEIKLTTSNARSNTDPNILLFFSSIFIWSFVGLIWLTHFFYSLCKRIKILPIHVLLIVYFPLRIAHSSTEYVYFLIISEQGLEHKNLFYASYAFETLSLSLLIFIFQLITAGYLVIEKNFNLCKIRKTIILIIFLIASFWLTLLVNWLISIALIVIFFIFLKMVCIDQSKNKNILLNIIKELNRQHTEKAALKIKISLLSSLNRWAWIFTLTNSAALAITILVDLEQKYIYSLIEQAINFLFYCYFLLLFRIQLNDERFKCLDDLRSTEEAPTPGDFSPNGLELMEIKDAEKHSSDSELREDIKSSREVSLRESNPKDISISLPSGVPERLAQVPRRANKRRKQGLLRSIMLSLSVPGKSLSVIDEGNSESVSEPSQFLEVDDIETCRSFPQIPDTLDIKKKQDTQ